METKKILGYRKFISKKGVPTCIVTVACPYSEREIASGACGTKTEEVWLPADCQDCIVPTAIGKNIELAYNISGGKAYIVGAVVK